MVETEEMLEVIYTQLRRDKEDELISAAEELYFSDYWATQLLIEMPLVREWQLKIEAAIGK